MVVAEEMDKPTLKVSVSDSDSSSIEDSDESENDTEMQIDEKTKAKSDSGSEASEENKGSDDDSDSALITNEGWADSVSKILGATKPKNKKTLVLSRAKKHSEVVKKEVIAKPEFEVIGDGEVKEENPDVKTEEGAKEPPVKKIKKEKPSIRLKPNILEKDRERLLTKIATKGVVQLFNAVRNQQKTLEKDLNSDLPESKKEKIMKKFDKRTFLDTLMGQSKSVVVDEDKSLKNKVKADEDMPKWNALRDNFMMGARMKDWDKESVDD